MARSRRHPEPSQVSTGQAAPPTPAYSRLSPSFGPRAGQEPSVIHANNLFMSHGINPMQLSETQFQSFQQQSPQVQQKSIEIYARNSAEHQRAAKAAGLTSQPCPYPQARDMLMERAKNLVARADQHIEAFLPQNVQEQQRATSEVTQIHAFDIDSTRQTAVNIWCQIQSKMLMDMESEWRAEKASKDAQSQSSPSQHGGSTETCSNRPEDATSGLSDNWRGGQALRPSPDERQYYFEITNPPQLNIGVLTKATTQEGSGLVGERLDKETTPLLELDHETNLTIEGRRQVCILPTGGIRSGAFWDSHKSSRRLRPTTDNCHSG